MQRFRTVVEAKAAICPSSISWLSVRPHSLTKASCSTSSAVSRSVKSVRAVPSSCRRNRVNTEVSCSLLMIDFVSRGGQQGRSRTRRCCAFIGITQRSCFCNSGSVIFLPKKHVEAGILLFTLPTATHTSPTKSLHFDFRPPALSERSVYDLCSFPYLCLVRVSFIGSDPLLMY